MTQIEWGQPAQGWQLSISMDKERFSVDEYIYVTIVTKNVSDIHLKIPISSKWTTYEYKLQYGNSDVPLTRFGKRMEENRGDGSYAEPDLPPGDTIVLELPLSRLFDLSLLGHYTLEVSRAVLREGTSELIPLISNKVTFEIVGG